MQTRIHNPATIVPGALEALQKFGNSAKSAGIPTTTLSLVELRASQINGCSVCVDMHSRELELAGENSERIHTRRCLAGDAVFHRRRARRSRSLRGGDTCRRST